MDPIELTKTWLQQAVIGLGLCPFARQPWERGAIRIESTGLEPNDDLLQRVLDEVGVLAKDGQISTTLIVLTYDEFEDFERFLDLCETIDDLLEQTGWDEEFVLANFHPDYQFGDANPDDLSNFTNRSPWPTLHLIRQSELNVAVQNMQDPSAIYKDNIRTMNELGADGIAALWAKWARD